MKISLQGRDITYILKRSKVARGVRLSIGAGGNLTVTLPERLSESYAERFIREKADWVLEKIDYFKRITPPDQKKLTTGDYIKYKYRAYRLAKERLEHFNQFYGYKYKNITIRNQKTRWGSCSRDGNLNFSFRIAFLPDELRDYVVVHELCHLGEFNHSIHFWKLVFKTIPNYRQLIRKLKPLGVTL